MFGFIKQMFTGLLSFRGSLASIVNITSHIKCFYLFVTQPTVINLHPNEYTQRLSYYPFAVNLDKCMVNCNTLNDLSNRICVSNKTEDLNLSILNFITKIV